ncbi:hypothetical protein BV22DRAFT_1133220 [Leucogyrophana mollusca]|uniref:Uncharacterized protein n=1 Tax=Leucogyrophana mollusca TaxID=85980 RepID=A0ACB8B3F4_9AGAM|nr:hypothetical protein BV22DRAFT_1133220 [Leucogyrophana mollusca]
MQLAFTSIVALAAFVVSIHALPAHEEFQPNYDTPVDEFGVEKREPTIDWEGPPRYDIGVDESDVEDSPA